VRECLRSGNDVAGAPDGVQVGGPCCLDPLCLADDVSPYRQGSKGVRCAGSSEHGPHLLKEGRMGVGGGGRRLVWCSTVWGGVGRKKIREGRWEMTINGHHA